MPDLAQISPAMLRRMRIASGLMIACGMLLCFDIGGEIYALILFPTYFSVAALVHLAAEVGATIGIGLAFAFNQNTLRRSVREANAAQTRLSALRGEFDRHMHLRFAEWRLSPAETDVALLTMRGLKITEIADMRGAQVGTIKSQLSKIFRKSGVTTRTEFVARFVDDFLDLPAPAPVAIGQASDRAS